MILCKYSHDQISRSPNTSVVPLLPTLTFKVPLGPRPRTLVQRWRGGKAMREGKEEEEGEDEDTPDL